MFKFNFEWCHEYNWNKYINWKHLNTILQYVNEKNRCLDVNLINKRLNLKYAKCGIYVMRQYTSMNNVNKIKTWLEDLWKLFPSESYWGYEYTPTWTICNHTNYHGKHMNSHLNHTEEHIHHIVNTIFEHTKLELS